MVDADCLIPDLGSPRIGLPWKGYFLEMEPERSSKLKRSQ